MRPPSSSLSLLLSASVAAAVGLVVACDDNPKNPPLGSMDITTSAPTAEQQFLTLDGWAIKFDRYLIHLSSVSVAGLDEVVAASSSPQIIDQVSPGPKLILTAAVRTARPWENVSFAIGPADAEATVTEPATEADRDMMQREGFSMYIEAKASKEGVNKTLKLGLKGATSYTECEGDLNGTIIKGLSIPAEGRDSADIVMGPDVIFSDDLNAVGGSTLLRGDAVMGADADNDGIVTTSELRAIPLEVVRSRTNAPYLVGSHPEVADLGAFIEELARSVVRTFRSPNGKCVAAPVVPDAP